MRKEKKKKKAKIKLKVITWLKLNLSSSPWKSNKPLTWSPALITESWVVECETGGELYECWSTFICFFFKKNKMFILVLIAH